MIDEHKIIRKEIHFEGRVQGVGFRYTAKYAASGCGVTGWVKNDYITKANWAEQMKTYTPTASLGAEIKKLNLFAPMQTTSDELINLSSRLDKLQNPDNPGNAYVTQNSLYKTLANIKYMNTKTPLLTRNDDDSFVLNDNDLATAIEKLTNKTGQPRFVTTKILLDDYTKTSGLKEYIEWLNTENQLFVTPSKLDNFGTLYAPINDLTTLQSKVNGMSDSLLTQFRNDKEFKTSVAAEINELYKELPDKVKTLEESITKVEGIDGRLTKAETQASEAYTKAEEAWSRATNASANTNEIPGLVLSVKNLTKDLENVNEYATAAGNMASLAKTAADDAKSTAADAKTTAESAVQPGKVVEQLALELGKPSAATCTVGGDLEKISTALGNCK